MNRFRLFSYSSEHIIQAKQSKAKPTDKSVQLMSTRFLFRQMCVYFVCVHAYRDGNGGFWIVVVFLFLFFFSLSSSALSCRYFCFSGIWFRLQFHQVL